MAYPILDGGEEDVFWDRSHGRCDGSFGRINTSLSRVTVAPVSPAMQADGQRGQQDLLVDQHLLQRRYDIRTLRGHAKLDLKAYAENLSLFHEWEWNTALKIATVRSLRGLRKSRLGIEWSMASGGPPIDEATTPLSQLH